MTIVELTAQKLPTRVSRCPQHIMSPVSSDGNTANTISEFRLSFEKEIIMDILFTGLFVLLFL